MGLILYPGGAGVPGSPPEPAAASTWADSSGLPHKVNREAFGAADLDGPSQRVQVMVRLTIGSTFISVWVQRRKSVLTV
jgi:hypothetical protein